MARMFAPATTPPAGIEDTAAVRGLAGRPVAVRLGTGRRYTRCDVRTRDGVEDGVTGIT